MPYGNPPYTDDDFDGHREYPSHLRDERRQEYEEAVSEEAYALREEHPDMPYDEARVRAKASLLGDDPDEAVAASARAAEEAASRPTPDEVDLNPFL